LGDIAETIRRMVDARGINYWGEFMVYVDETSDDPKYVARVFLGDEDTDRLDYYLQLYADFIELLLEELYGIGLRMYVDVHWSDEYCYDCEIVAKKTITVVRNGEEYCYELNIYSEGGGIPYSSEEEFNRCTAGLLERIRNHYRAIADVMERAHVRDTDSGWKYVTG